MLLNKLFFLLSDWHGHLTRRGGGVGGGSERDGGGGASTELAAAASSKSFTLFFHFKLFYFVYCMLLPSDFS